MSSTRHDTPTADPRARDEKRKQFTSPPKWSVGRWLPLGAFAAAVLFAVAFGLLSRGGNEDRAPSAGAPAAPTRVESAPDGQVRLALADLNEGRAKFYEYPSADGRNIRFFARLGGDGVYRAALDACEVCYHAKKGYYQRGDEMVCRQCGNSYAPALIDEAPGGCHPVGLPRSVEGDHLAVMARDIERAEARLASQPPPRLPMRPVR